MLVSLLQLHLCIVLNFKGVNNTRGFIINFMGINSWMQNYKMSALQD